MLSIDIAYNLSKNSLTTEDINMLNRRKLILSLLALFAANVLLILVMKTIPDAQATTFRYGSQGDIVRQIQTKLKNWGYYEGILDGDYGPRTVEAIKFFQRKNSLNVDGVAGTRTLQALGIYLPETSAVSAQKINDTELLARLINAEAKDEPYNCQVAVGAVVLNRVKHPSFPNTIASVIYQQGTFPKLNNANNNKPISETARRAALDAISGVDPSFNSVYYYDSKVDTDQRLTARTTILEVGNFKFCK